MIVELAVSTFNTGLAVLTESPTWKSFPTANPVGPYLLFSTPAIDILNSSAA